jgi:hypothetical protein
VTCPAATACAPSWSCNGTSSCTPSYAAAGTPCAGGTCNGAGACVAAQCCFSGSCEDWDQNSSVFQFLWPTGTAYSPFFFCYSSLSSCTGGQSFASTACSSGWFTNACSCN